MTTISASASSDPAIDKIVAIATLWADGWR
jgi:hypothetical protein